MTSAADRAQLEHILRAGSRTFFFASRALPRRMREPTLALYAFCRKADDSVDDVRSSEAAHAAVAALRARIERVYSGAALDDVVERCFARTVHELGIPRRELDLLAEGMPSALVGSVAFDSCCAVLAPGGAASEPHAATTGTTPTATSKDTV